MKNALLSFLVASVSASAQTNPGAPGASLKTISNSPAQSSQSDTNQGLALAQRIEDVRTVCIQKRRIICGKILKILPEGIVVDSGYTNLMRVPLNQSWLIPGTVVANRVTNLVEGNEPDSICFGLVFLTDIPKKPGAKPKLFDYVNLEGFPMGTYTYISVGNVRRTVREFTTKVANSVRWNFDQSVNQNVPPK